jgi:hypothetical protein
MEEEPRPVHSSRLRTLVREFHNKEFRDTYVAAHTRRFLARQMRKFRGQMSQTEFAGILDKRQTIVSRLENPNYSGWTLSTLLEIASKLDVGVFVRFVDFPTFLKYTGVQSEAALHPKSYDAKEIDDFAQAPANFKAEIPRALEILKTPLLLDDNAAKEAATKSQASSKASSPQDPGPLGTFQIVNPPPSPSDWLRKPEGAARLP